MMYYSSGHNFYSWFVLFRRFIQRYNMKQHIKTHRYATNVQKSVSSTHKKIKVNKYQRDFLSGLKPCLMGWSALNTSQTTPKSRQSTPISSIKSEPPHFERSSKEIMIRCCLIWCFVKDTFWNEKKRCCPCTKKNLAEKLVIRCRELMLVFKETIKMTKIW